MRLAAVEIKNFRSIERTGRIDIGDSLTLIGPNNEGKSNIVLAIVTALKLLQELNRPTTVRTGVGLYDIYSPKYDTNRTYDWERDYPIRKQLSSNDGASEFILEFLLSDQERIEFKEEIKSSINGTLPIKISVGRGPAKFTVLKKGPGASALSAKATKISRFIGQRLKLSYIPAVRNAADAKNVVDRVIESALRKTEDDSEFQNALNVIFSKQQSAVAEIETQLGRLLRLFLPNVSNVKIDVSQESRRRALRAADIIVDDGIATSLSRKGDGVVSLVAMALLSSGITSSDDRDTILAFEEPESHLHPRAIHLIRRSLDAISKDRQIIVTTHSPVLVNRREVSSNIIVERNRSRMANSISEVRGSLGVRLSDNLSHARCILLCEGDSDAVILKHAAKFHFPNLLAAINDGELAIQSLSGVGNLSHHASSTRASACEVIAFIDHDVASKQALKSAEDDKVLEPTEVVMTKRLGFSESEIEDLLEDDFVASVIRSELLVDINALPKDIKKRKFSEKIYQAIEISGLSGRTVIDAKVAICKALERETICRIDTSKIQPFKSISNIIDSKLVQV